MTSAFEAARFLKTLIEEEITEAAEAHRAGTVPTDHAAHWAWTHERDKRLDRLDAMYRHFIALPPGKDIDPS